MYMLAGSLCMPFLSLLLGEDARRQKVGMDVDMSKYWCYMNYIMK